MKLHSLWIAGLVFSFSGGAMANGNSSVINLMQRGYYQSHQKKKSGDPKANVPGATSQKSQIQQFKSWMDRKQPRPTVSDKARDLVQSPARSKVLTPKIKVLGRWSKRIWSFFSFQSIRKLNQKLKELSLAEGLMRFPMVSR